MPGKVAFAVKITFMGAVNPRGTKDRLEDELRQFVLGLGLECYLGPFGGITTTYGFIWADDGERDLLAARGRVEGWLRERRISGLCKLGDLEDFEMTDINRDVAGGRAFSVDNLTDEDRRVAAEWRRSC